MQSESSAELRWSRRRSMTTMEKILVPSFILAIMLTMVLFVVFLSRGQVGGHGVRSAVESEAVLQEAACLPASADPRLVAVLTVAPLMLLCTGAKVAPGAALVPASCPLATATLWARTRSAVWHAGGGLHQVLEVVYHIGYNAATLANNLAVVKFKDDRPGGQGDFFTIPPPKRSFQALSLAGWGQTPIKRGFIDERSLQIETISILSKPNCNHYLAKHNITTKNTMCGHFFRQCSKDLAGCAIDGQELIAVAWFGRGTQNYPYLMLDVREYADWINNNKIQN